MDSNKIIAFIAIEIVGYNPQLSGPLLSADTVVDWLVGGVPED